MTILSKIVLFILTVSLHTSSEIFWTEVCSHRISALKDEATFETANHTLTMVRPKIANRNTYSKPAATKRTILGSQEPEMWL